MSAAEREIRRAYDATASGWRRGPHRVYSTLARASLDELPLSGRLVLDVGAGTGAVSDAVHSSGGRAVACDFAARMLQHLASHRDRVAADACALPFRDGAVDVAVAAFLLSHLEAPARALAEMGRVTRADGHVVATVFAVADEHPAIAAVDRSAAEHGYRQPSWHVDYKRSREPMTSTPDAMRVVAQAAGLVDIDSRVLRIDTGLSSPREVVEYRVGMAHMSDFVGQLDQAGREGFISAAIDAVAAVWSPVSRDVVVLRARPGSATG